MKLSDRLAKLESVLNPVKYIYVKTVDYAPVDRLDLVWWGEPFLREEGESEHDFIERCKHWADINYAKGRGSPALFLQYPHF